MAQAVTGPKPEKTFHLANNMIALLLVAVAAIFFGAGWYAGKHPSTMKSTAASQNSNQDFNTYTNQQNGFRVNYPSSWGKPNFTTADVNGGKSYNLKFFKKDNTGKLQYYIFLTMVSDKAKSMTGTNIKDLIKNNSDSMLVHDDSSFATVAGSAQNKSSSLASFQVVDLSKIGVSAASLSYQISGGSADCQTNKFATNSGGACIERTDYYTVNSVLKSIKTL